MIEINNLTTNIIDEKFLEKVAKAVLEGEEKKEADLSIAFIGQQRMRKLNKRYRGKNRATDVLAFGKNHPVAERSSLRGIPVRSPAPEQSSVLDQSRTETKFLVRGSAFVSGQKFPPFSKSELSLEEIVICLREVKKNAKRFGQSFEKELATCLIHGILHLLNYDHEKNETEARKMEEKQKYYLSQLKFNL